MFSGGGDPLYYPKIDEVIQHARSLGLEISISTNGGSLEKPMRQLLLATVKGHIRFSIDSGNPHAHFQLHRPLNENGKDDFETIVANVADLIRERGRRTRPVIGMSFILHPNNVDSLPLFLERAIELHVDFVDIKQNYRFSRSANDNLSSKAHPIVQEYAQKAHRMDIKFQHFTPRKGLSNASKCAQSWYMLDLVAVITSDGKLYPCCHLMSPDYCQGDIITQSFSSVWFSESRNQWRENLLKNGIACRVCVDKQLEKKLRLVATALTADDEAAVEEAFIELMK
jgi:radical SAM protein with 4Fe4S-binding SPASM domain